MPGGKMASIEEGIAECMECHRVCTETLTYCLRQGKAYVEPSHVQLLIDCAQICQTTADLMTRGSDVACQMCEVAAYVCERTAVSCERWASTDSQMKRCADACSRSGENCRKIMMAA
jgi:hypothetical protein